MEYHYLWSKGSVAVSIPLPGTLHGITLAPLACYAFPLVYPFLCRSYPVILTSASLDITSAEFTSKPQPARHRMVYALLKDELERQGGIHALQLRTKTPEEVEREEARNAQGS